MIGVIHGMRPELEVPGEECPVCDGSPTVLVGIRHLIMRRLTIDLLVREHGCWKVEQPSAGELLAEAITRTHPDLVVIDSVDFPDRCLAALHALPPERVVVVGPEPDPSYRDRALTQGAGGWVCRDRVGDELSVAMRSALGCRHAPCMPIARRTVSERSFRSTAGDSQP